MGNEVTTTANEEAKRRRVSIPAMRHSLILTTRNKLLDDELRCFAAHASQSQQSYAGRRSSHPHDNIESWSKSRRYRRYQDEDITDSGGDFKNVAYTECYRSGFLIICMYNHHLIGRLQDITRSYVPPTQQHLSNPRPHLRGSSLPRLPSFLPLLLGRVFALKELLNHSLLHQSSPCHQRVSKLPLRCIITYALSSSPT